MRRRKWKKNKVQNTTRFQNVQLLRCGNTNRRVTDVQQLSDKIWRWQINVNKQPISLPISSTKRTDNRRATHHIFISFSVLQMDSSNRNVPTNVCIHSLLHHSLHRILRIPDGKLKCLYYSMSHMSAFWATFFDAYAISWCSSFIPSFQNRLQQYFLYVVMTFKFWIEDFDYKNLENVK